MSSGTTRFVLLMMLFISCGTPTTPYQAQLSQLKKTAIDSLLPIQDRLYAAQQADALVTLKKDKISQIEFARIIGLLYISEDSVNKAKYWYHRLAALGEATGDYHVTGVAYNNISLQLSKRSAYDSAIYYASTANNFFKKGKDTIYLAKGLINEGILYKNIGSFDMAYKRTTDGLNLLHPDSLIDRAAALGTLGNVMKEMTRYTKAIEYFSQAIKIYQTLHDTSRLANTLNNMGNVLRRQQNSKQALNYYFQALQLKEQYGNHKTAIQLDNISQTYLDLHRYDSAEIFIMRALLQQDRENDLEGYMTSMNRLAALYFARNNIRQASAIAFTNLKLAEEKKYKQQLLDNVQLLADISQAQHDYVQANAYARRALILKDSIFNSDMADKVSQMEIRYQTTEQQAALTAVRQQSEMQSAEIALQRNSNIFALLIILILIIFTYNIYRTSQFRKKAKEKVDQLMHELNHRVKNNMELVSSILYLQGLTTSQPGELAIIEAAGSRIHFMADLHELLHEKTYTGLVPMQSFIKKLAESINNMSGNANFTLRFFIDMGETLLITDRAIPLGMIVNELLTNIYKYSNKRDLNITIKLENVQNTYKLSVIDDDLAWDLNGSKGLGSTIITQLVKDLKGQWQAYREANNNYQVITFK